MNKQWDYDLIDSYKPALSVLFNSFILAQVRVHVQTEHPLCNKQCATQHRAAPGAACCLRTFVGKHGQPGGWQHRWAADMHPSRPLALSRCVADHALAACSCLQVANAFVSRRIGLELNFFEGITKSHVFNIIMLVITAMQVVIMQTPISFVFKVGGRGGGLLPQGTCRMRRQIPLRLRAGLGSTLYRHCSLSAAGGGCCVCVRVRVCACARIRGTFRFSASTPLRPDPSPPHTTTATHAGPAPRWRRMGRLLRYWHRRHSICLDCTRHRACPRAVHWGPEDRGAPARPPRGQGLWG
jgi:hypothetical protein